MVEFLIGLAATLAGIAFLLALWRFIKGPTPADRVIAAAAIGAGAPLATHRRANLR